MFNPLDKLLRDDDLNALRKDRIASTKKRAGTSEADLQRAAFEAQARHSEPR